MAEGLKYRVRESKGDPQGALVLFHGRGADENDLFPLFDLLDPEQRFVGVTPRGPLSLPPGGAHWYVVHRVGYPNEETFLPTFDRASRWLDTLLDELGITHDSLILGGFSQGCVMSYSLSFAAGRPGSAGVLAFSGFIPTVEGFELDLAKDTRVAIGHGIHDPVIGVEWGRDANDRLTAAGVPEVLYREYPLPHTIDPDFAREAAQWVIEAVPSR